MEFGFYSFLQLIGALGFFIFGMKVMSEGIQKAAGDKMRQLMGVMTKNRFFGIFTGFIITGLVQSSSATTVMTVSFVNAGLLTLAESAGILMGANIGTTLMAWLISVLGFELQIVAITLPIIALGLPLMFMKGDKYKAIGECLIGFALLFMGLEALITGIPDLFNYPEVPAFIAGYMDMGILSIILFIGIGILLTIVVQSSSAAMALTLVLCYNGWIPLENAAAMVLGENIGTTITAELAALVGNTDSKRAARFHSAFNLFGVIWMVFAFSFYLDMIDFVMVHEMGMASPYQSSASIPIALAFFHSAFNLSNVILMVGFIPYLVRLVTKMLPGKGEEDQHYRLEHIGTGLMSTPELSLLEAKKEVVKMGKLTKKMNGFVQTLLQEKDKIAAADLYAKVLKYEDITDRVEVEIAQYLTETSTGELSEKASVKVRSMLSMVGDLERIADIFYQMSKTIERKNELKAWFTPEQRSNLSEMFELLETAFDEMLSNMHKDWGIVRIDQAKNYELKINQLRDRLRTEHLQSIEREDYNYKSGMIYSDLFASCEKIGDHIINVSEAVSGKI